MNNNEMREATGRVTDGRALVAFLYTLMRDWLPAGMVDAIVSEDEKVGPDKPVLYTNGHLARYAVLLADRLAPPWPASVPDGPTPDSGLTFAEFARVNRTRCESKLGFNHKLESWSLSDWAVATLGELGEAANLIKKLNRLRDGVRTKESREYLDAALFREVGDAAIYLDLFAQAAGFCLEDAIQESFNAKSAEIGYPFKLKNHCDGAAVPPRPDARDLLIADLYGTLQQCTIDVAGTVDDGYDVMERARAHLDGLNRRD